MSSLLNKFFWIFIGMIIAVVLFFVLKIDKIQDIMKDLNDNYSPILNAISSLILVVITLVYVIITYFISKASSKSVKETQKQLSFSKVPVVIAELLEAKGTKYFGDKRRQLHINLKVKNIGDGPAIQLYIKIKMIYNHVEFEYFDELYEYTFAGNLSVEQEENVELRFETKKIEKMIEDLSIRYAKNIYRVKNNPSQSAFSGPELSLELIYSNVHGQFFKSTIINEILSLDAYRRKPEQERYVYWTSEKSIKDNEAFKLMMKNPIFQTNEFSAIDKNDAENFIQKYKNLL